MFKRTIKKSLLLALSLVFVGVTANADVGIIQPGGEVFLFYKNDANTVMIQQCEDLTILNARSDCKLKTGTFVAKIPADEFKVRLLSALKMPLGEYPMDVQNKVDQYRAGVPSWIDVNHLDSQRDSLQTSLNKMQAFANQYGATADSALAIAKIQAQMDEVNLAAGLVEPVREINTLIDQLLDQVMGKSNLQTLVYSDEKHGFEYTVLRTYLQIPGINVAYVSIPHGAFTMGSSKYEKDRSADEPQHPVILTRDFDLQKTDVTQLQWFLVMGTNPSYYKTKQDCGDEYIELSGVLLCPNNPVEQVSWVDTQAFINKLNAKKDGFTYRLPTEAEWEYAARAGATTAYYFGDDSADLPKFGWSGTGKSSTHPVGKLLPNAWGLYDMTGNVWQWTNDFYGDYPDDTKPKQQPGGIDLSKLFSKKVSETNDPRGPASGELRVYRGGSCHNAPKFLRSAQRFETGELASSSVLGFRLVRTLKN